MTSKRKANLQSAKQNKKDEFYTQMVDIENELQHYEDQFRGKAVYCNCDTPFSNFYRYFSKNFNRLGLRRLATCASDFRGRDSIAVLRQADIVVTNPPYSLFREYVAQLLDYDKKFLILGHQNAYTYKDFFPFLKDGVVKIGISVRSGDREFRVPDDYPMTAASSRIDEQGNKFVRVSGVRWFTNMEHLFVPPPLLLTRKYNPVDYPRYDDHEAINVARTKHIPVDYEGLMGVPVTFMDKHNPEQFKIVDSELNGLLLNGKKTYCRIIIQRK